MLESLIPMVVMTGMFGMIFGIVYIRSRENMAMIERGHNPRQVKSSPRPYVSLKYGLLLIGCGLGLLAAYIVDHNLVDHGKSVARRRFSIGSHHSRKNAIAMPVDSGHADTDTIHHAMVNVSITDNGGNEDEHSIAEISGDDDAGVPIYFALIAIGGGLGLFFSYRIEKKEWLDKQTVA